MTGKTVAANYVLVMEAVTVAVMGVVTVSVTIAGSGCVRFGYQLGQCSVVEQRFYF